MDKIPTAAAILIGVSVVAIIAGFNDQLGKFLFVFMLIIAMAWLIGGGTQGHLSHWASILNGKSSSSNTGGVSIV